MDAVGGAEMVVVVENDVACDEMARVRDLDAVADGILDGHFLQ